MTIYEGDSWVIGNEARRLWRNYDETLLHEAAPPNRVFTSIDEARLAKGPVWVEVYGAPLPPPITPPPIVIEPVVYTPPPQAVTTVIAETSTQKEGNNMPEYEGDNWVIGNPANQLWRYSNGTQLYEVAAPYRTFQNIDEARLAKGPVWIEVRAPSAVASTSGTVAQAAPQAGGYFYTLPQQAQADAIPQWMIWAGVGLAAWFLLKK